MNVWEWQLNERRPLSPPLRAAERKKNTVFALYKNKLQRFHLICGSLPDQRERERVTGNLSCFDSHLKRPPESHSYRISEMRSLHHLRIKKGGWITTTVLLLLLPFFPYLPVLFFKR